jgi:hypothetical protein
LPAESAQLDAFVDEEVVQEREPEIKLRRRARSGYWDAGSTPDQVHDDDEGDNGAATDGAARPAGHGPGPGPALNDSRSGALAQSPIVGAYTRLLVVQRDRLRRQLLELRREEDEGNREREGEGCLGD